MVEYYSEMASVVSSRKRMRERYFFTLEASVVIVTFNYPLLWMCQLYTDNKHTSHFSVSSVYIILTLNSDVALLILRSKQSSCHT
jgi:hypothetical protein